VSFGRGMYPGYQQYWRAILANPGGILPFTGRVASKGEIEYAYFADKTPHIVLSKTLDQVDWKNTWIVRDVEEIRRLKQWSGKDIYAVGGATLISGLMNMSLIDEVRLLVNPFILGGGKALFKDVKDRHVLKLVQAKSVQVWQGQYDLHHAARHQDSRFRETVVAIQERALCPYVYLSS
jgi:dihydrofolate reductase